RTTVPPYSGTRPVRGPRRARQPGVSCGIGPRVGRPGAVLPGDGADLPGRGPGPRGPGDLSEVARRRADEGRDGTLRGPRLRHPRTVFRGGRAGARGGTVLPKGRESAGSISRGIARVGATPGGPGADAGRSGGPSQGPWPPGRGRRDPPSRDPPLRNANGRLSGGPATPAKPGPELPGTG